ncbi:ParB/RepB/Spo0J family partition protein [Pseudonocardia sp. NPDC049635]|uniref:ParB/RepB/Spo0J family partition protein n=1 Tax=Pseudonocardia sp. NPDC049635 TaxID=3155506 RepID=UPI0033F24347
MAKKKDFGAMERGRPAGTGAERARDALRTRLAAPPSKLPLEQLQPNPLNPRDPDDDEDLKELAATMRQHGQLQQAQVIAREDFLAAFPDTADQLSDAPWVVFIGNRRLRAARLAGLAMLDVKAPEGVASPEEIESRVLIENLQRSDLPLLKEAEFLQRQLSRDGQSLRTVAAAIGKSFMYVQQRVALLKLIPELQDQLRHGTLTFKTARTLCSLSPDEQAAVYSAGPPWSVKAQAPPRGPAVLSSARTSSGSGDEAGSAEEHEVPSPASADVATAAGQSSVSHRAAEMRPATAQPVVGKALVAPLVGSVSTVLEEIRRSQVEAGPDAPEADVLDEAARQVEAALATLRKV